MTMIFLLMLGIFYVGVTVGWSMASLVAVGRRGHPHVRSR